MKKLVKKEELFGGLFSALLTLGILLLGFAVGGMFPFGKGTLAWCDMSQQLIPLFCDFKDVLSGESSFFHSTANAGGMNFYGVYFFFLSSPFTYLVAFVSKADIPYLMNILVILKLATASFSAGFVIKKLAKRLDYGTVAALCCSYALCGYSMMYYQNIMWLDIMYMFPLVVWGIYRLMKYNKPIVLTVTLTVTVLLNFYLSFMVYLFVILFFGLFAFLYRRANKKLYSNLALSGLISLACSAFVWLPCLLQYIASARNGNGMMDLVDTTLFAPTDTTIPILLGSGLIFAVLILTIPRFSEIGRENKHLLYGFILTSVPLVLEPINRLWHAGSYMSFPARYSFITVFLGIVLAATVLNKEGGEKNHRVMCVLGCMLLILPAMAFGLSYSNQGVLSSYVSTLWGDNGSLKMLGLISLLFILSYTLILVLRRKKLINNRLVACILCGIVAIESFCSMQTYMLSAKNKFDVNQYRKVLALSEDLDDKDFYRVNLAEKSTHANMVGAAGLNSLSHYTSLNNRDYMEAAKKLGYSGYWMETGSWGGSIISDALLSVGYIVDLENFDYSLKKNPYYLGLGIYSKGEIPETTENRDRLMSVGQVFAQITGSKNSVKKYKYSFLTDCSIIDKETSTVIEKGEGEAAVEYNINIKGAKTLYFDCFNGFSTELIENINDSFAVYVNNECVTESYPSQSFNGLLNLGSFKNEKVKVELKVLKDVSCTSFGVFSVDETVVKKAIKNTETANLKYENGKYSGQVKQGSLFVSIPRANSFHIRLNGKVVSCHKVLNGFYEIELPENGELVIRFRPQGLIPGILLSLVGAAFFTWFLMHLKKKQNSFEKIYSVIYGVFIGVASVAFLIVYIIPIILALSDFIP